MNMSIEGGVPFQGYKWFFRVWVAFPGTVKNDFSTIPTGTVRNGREHLLLHSIT